MAVTNQKPNGAALFIPGSVLKREISSVVYLICFFLCRRLGYEERDSGTPHPYPSSQAIGQNCPLKSENKSMNCVPASVFHLVLLAISVLGTLVSPADLLPPVLISWVYLLEIQL
jgi:hypothetical protein